MTVREEIATAHDQLVALLEETHFELWQLDLEADLMGLALKMAEWVRVLERQGVAS